MNKKQKGTNKSLYQLPEFKFAFFLPIILAISLAVTISQNSDMSRCGSYECFNFAYQAFKVPILVFSMIFPAVALVASNHRSVQTKRQIDIALEHNELSVRPAIVVAINTGYEGCFIRLENRGVGPAQISELALSYDNEAFEIELLPKKLEESIASRSVNLVHLSQDQIKIHSKLPTFDNDVNEVVMVSAGKDFELVSFNISTVGDLPDITGAQVHSDLLALANFYRDTLRRFSVKIDYLDMYNNSFSCNESFK